MRNKTPTKKYRDARIRVAIKIYHRGLPKSEIGVTRNLSRGGLFLVTKPTHTVGTVVPIKLIYRYWSLDLDTQVAHVQKEGIGLRFIKLTPHLEDGIKTVINGMLADGAWFDEQRKALRTEVNGPIVWVQQGVEIESYLKNLTLEGALLEIDLPSECSSLNALVPRIDSTITLYIPGFLAAQQDPQLSEVQGCEAIVRHHSKAGFGVEFVSPSKEFTQAVDVILKTITSEDK